MSRAAQIAWWVAQVEAARTAVGAAAGSRRRPGGFSGIDEDSRGRAARVAPLSKAPPADYVIRGQTITGPKINELVNVDRRFVRNIREALFVVEKQGAAVAPQGQVRSRSSPLFASSRTGILGRTH